MENQFLMLSPLSQLVVNLSVRRKLGTETTPNSQTRHLLEGGRDVGLPTPTKRKDGDWKFLIVSSPPLLTLPQDLVIDKQLSLSPT